MSNILFAVAALTLASFGMGLGTTHAQSTAMSFFVTSEGTGNGANLAVWPVRTRIAKSWLQQPEPGAAPGAPI